MEHLPVPCPDWMAAHISDRGGVISFFDFMDLALNDMKNGSYATGKLRIGPKGDFVTSPSLGPEFCDLLASQVVDWVEALLHTDVTSEVISIIDIGPGEGDLLFHLIEALQKKSPSLFKKIKLILIEINEGMKDRQKRRLAPFKDIPICWMSMKELSDVPVKGIMIAHEILDALPVDRVVSNNNKLFMQGVKLSTLNNKHYIEFTNLPLSDSIKNSIIDISNKIDISIPPQNSEEGWSTEWHSCLNNWFKETSLCLTEGPLLIIDYALEANRYYSKSRSEGTIISYSSQVSNSNILEKIGTTDITSHLCLEIIYLLAIKNNWNFVGERKQGLSLLALGLADKLNDLKQIPNSKLGEALTKRENLLRLIDPSCLGDFRWILFNKSSSANSDILQSRFLKEPND